MAKSEDPVVRSSRREAIITGITFLAALAWTVGYCGMYGYGRKVADLKFVFGLPDWIFWGVVFPWSVCIIFSIIFGAFVMGDEDLGAEPPPEEEGF